MTTPNTLVVLMNGARMGAIEQSDGKLSFTYSDEWRFTDDATPLSVSMPLTTARHEDSKVRAFLWGLLPDNEAVLERWGHDYGVSSRNPYALISNVGEDCAGAALFVRPDRLDLIANDGSVQSLRDSDIADLLRALEEDPTSWHGPTATGQFSLAGAQPKFALLLEDGTWGQPRGSIPTTHIFKRATNAFKDLEVNEHVCLSVARDLGLPAAKTRIAKFGNQQAIVIERYDRAKQDGVWARVHQEDLCQAFAVHPELKYQSLGGPSPAKIAALLRDVQPADRADESIRRFVDALIFNWIVGGTDAHAKNYSLLLSGSDVVLAPLYDVASVLPYSLDLHKLTFAMKIGHSYGFLEIAARDWSRLADELGVDNDWLTDRILQLCNEIPPAFEVVSGDPSVKALGSDLPQELLSSVADRAAKCAELFTSLG